MLVADACPLAESCCRLPWQMGGHFVSESEKSGNKIQKRWEIWIKTILEHPYPWNTSVLKTLDVITNGV